MNIRKAVKIIVWIIALVIAIPVILVATLPLWLGPIARPALNAAAPGYTGTSFNIGHLYLNPYTGRFELGDMVVGNPKGYNEPTAIAVSNLVVDVAMTTLNDKYVHVEEVIADGLFLSVVSGGENGVDNLLQIQYNLAGGKERYEANVESNKAKKAEAQAKADAKAKAELEKEKSKLDKMTDAEREAYEQKKADIEEAKAAGEKKYVVDHVLIRNVKIKYGMVTIPVPVDIELRDLGKKTDGVNFSEFFDAVWEAILKAATSVGDGAKALGGLLTDGAKNLGEGAVKAANAVTEGAGKAANTVKEGAGKAVDSVKEGAGKAADAIKGLFK